MENSSPRTGCYKSHTHLLHGTYYSSDSSQIPANLQQPTQTVRYCLDSKSISKLVLLLFEEQELTCKRYLTELLIGLQIILSSLCLQFEKSTFEKL